MERHLTIEQLGAYRRHLLEEERSAATIGKYTRDLAAFSAFLGEAAVTKETVIQYKQHLVGRYKPASVNSMLAAVNGYLKFEGWLDCVVKPLKIQRQSFREQERELTREEYFRLLEEARAQGNERLWLMMQTICATGIRIGELPFITVEAARQGRAVVSLKGKTRTVLLPGSLCRALEAYGDRRHLEKGPIFVSKSGLPMDRSNILHEMKKLAAGAAVPSEKIFPHNLRHLFACQFYQATKDLSRLADVLGHTNVNTTRIYTSVSGTEQSQQIEMLGLLDVWEA